MSQRSSVAACGVTFEIVSNVPGVSASGKSERFVLVFFRV